MIIRNDATLSALPMLNRRFSDRPNLTTIARSLVLQRSHWENVGQMFEKCFKNVSNMQLQMLAKCSSNSHQARPSTHDEHSVCVCEDFQ